MLSREDNLSIDPLDGFSPWSGRNFEDDEGSPISSNHSSCVGSEIERYCSANSIMGTASVCSSVGNVNEFRDFDHGCQNFSKNRGNLYNLEENLNGLTEQNNTFCSDKQGSTVNSVSLEGDAHFDVGNHSHSSMKANENSSQDTFCVNKELNGPDGFNGPLWFYDGDNDDEGSQHSHNEMPFLSNLDQGIPFSIINGRHELGNFSNDDGSDDSRIEGLNSENRAPAHEKVLEEGLEEHEGSSPRCENLYDKSSLFVSDMEDENKASTHDKRKFQNTRKVQLEHESGILMTSNEAFGLGDWEDFAREIENNLPNLSLNNFSIEKIEQKEIEKGILKLSDYNYVVPVGSSILHQTIHAADVSVSQEGQCSSTKIKMDKGKCLSGRHFPDEAPYTKGLLLPEDESDIQFASNLEKDMQGIVEFPVDPLSLSFIDYRDSTVISSPFSDGCINFDFTKSSEQNLEVIEHQNGISARDKVVDPMEHDEVSVTHNGAVHQDHGSDNFTDIVHDMEEILLESRETHASVCRRANHGSFSYYSEPYRDGASTASTSSADEKCPLRSPCANIDWVEVIGTKQKRGDVSFGERLVGVKEHTVYKLRVWSGKNQWEVERRYRDFYALFHQLKTYFANHGQTMPSAWFNVERESRKIFGNASPDVINERSSLIQECLRSILHIEYPSKASILLVQFLSVQDVSTSLSLSRSNGTDAIPLGKTISLIVDIHPQKSVKQMLEAQNYQCAGCHKYMDSGKSPLQELVKTFGFGKSRLCEYTGQLFCASCHTNETSVLPARVLHLWDFSLYPVSQLAKAYLESIYEQPMLCVSAVNPFLSSKVPALFHVMGVRKRMGAMLPFILCSFRRSFQRGLGPRRYLLESHDFFALRDLVDLSKGPFAALPIMVETIAEKIYDHITQRCLVCFDVGVSCGARQACEDPSSLIFPFQEGEIKRCASCALPFHKNCITKLGRCPCESLRSDKNSVTVKQGSLTSNAPRGTILDNFLNSGTADPKSPVSYISDLLSVARLDRIWRSKKSNPVILMGSLPSNTM